MRDVSRLSKLVLHYSVKVPTGLKLARFSVYFYLRTRNAGSSMGLEQLADADGKLSKQGEHTCKQNDKDGNSFLEES